MNPVPAILSSLRRWLEKPVQHPARAAFILVTVAFAFFFIVCTPAFRRDDTAAMMWIANGTFTDTPSPYLVFSNILFGKLLVQLYTIAPDIPFYPLALYLILFGSFFLVTWYLLRIWPVRYSLLTSSAFIAVFALTQFLMKLEFTQVALAATAAALLSFLQTTRLPTAIRTSLVLGFSCLAFMIRSDVFFIFLPLALIIAFSNRGARLASVLTIVLVCSIFWLLLDYHNSSYQSDPEWKTFYDFNLARGKVIDYKITVPPERQHALGLTDVDIKALKAWVIHDTNIITPRIFRELGAYVPGRFFINSATLAWLADSVSDNISKQVFKPTNILSLLAIMISILIACPSRKARLVLLPLTLAAILIVPAALVLVPVCCFFVGKRLGHGQAGLLQLGVVFLIFYLAIIGRIPNFLASGLSAISILFFLAASSRSLFGQTSQKAKDIGILFLLAVIVVSTLLACLKLSPANAERQEKFQQLSAELVHSFPPETAFVLYPPAFIEDFGLFRTSKLEKALGPRLIVQGWLSHTPVQQQQLRVNNFSSIRELLFSKRTCVITSWEKRFMYLDRFCRQHYGHGVAAIAIQSNIYQLTIDTLESADEVSPDPFRYRSALPLRGLD